jgi:PAS domain S-box-containing protein
MTGEKITPPQGDALRKRAEEIAWGKAARMSENPEALSPEETRRTLHELRVHQIELEMQNEELRRTQKDLDAAQARYFDLYDLAPVGYCTVSEKGLILEANLTAATLLGVARSALVKQPISRFILKEDQDIYYRHRKQLFETHSTSSGQAGEPQACELRMVKMEGTAFWAHLEATAAWDADGAPLCRVVMSDITGRKQAEAALQQAHDELEQRVAERTAELRRANEELRTNIFGRRQADVALKESEEKYHSLAASVDSMYLVDRDCIYLFMNEGHRMRFGLPLEEIIGRRYGEFHSEGNTKEFADCIREVCETGKPIIKEHWSERDGRYFLRTFTPIMGRRPVGEISKVVIVSKDITNRKQAEKDLIKTVQQLQETRDMLIQFEKHAAVGRLAASVAHEILNPASIISSHLQFLEEENLAEPARENLRVSREQLERIVKISRDLHQSAAKQPGMLAGGDLRRIIEVGLQMTERRIKEDHVQVEYEPPPAVIPVKMERDRLVKVMVNLILNACDAMMGNQSKRLIITVHRPENSLKDHSIFLTVADNGHGILAGELDMIFEPFFTRKDPGKGTGLGLSVSKGIIQEHGGTIYAKNNDMGGASFIVELPLDHP